MVAPNYKLFISGRKIIIFIEHWGCSLVNWSCNYTEFTWNLINIFQVSLSFNKPIQIPPRFPQLHHGSSPGIASTDSAVGRSAEATQRPGTAMTDSGRAMTWLAALLQAATTIGNYRDLKENKDSWSFRFLKITSTIVHYSTIRIYRYVIFMLFRRNDKSRWIINHPTAPTVPRVGPPSGGKVRAIGSGQAIQK